MFGENQDIGKRLRLTNLPARRFDRKYRLIGEEMIALPTISELRRIAQSLATLDLILMPEWQYRYYSFNSKWSRDEQMASMRDGCGDEWFLLFHRTGWAGLKGFAHESSAVAVDGLSKGLQQAVPDIYKSFSTELAFRWESTTFCLWCAADESSWQTPAELEGVGTGADDLLGIIGSGPEGYHRFAQDYYEREIDLHVVEQVFQHRVMDATIVSALTAEITLDDIQEELTEIGYPQ